MPRVKKGTTRGKKSTAGSMKKKGQSGGVYHEIGKSEELPKDGWTE